MIWKEKTFDVRFDFKTVFLPLALIFSHTLRKG